MLQWDVLWTKERKPIKNVLWNIVWITVTDTSDSFAPDKCSQPPQICKENNQQQHIVNLHLIKWVSSQLKIEKFLLIHLFLCCDGSLCGTSSSALSYFIFHNLWWLWCVSSSASDCVFLVCPVRHLFQSRSSLDNVSRLTANTWCSLGAVFTKTFFLPLGVTPNSR